ncbi:hypothetical protein SLS59_000613 [Nothophoma quercina]|uniref:Uncharacterized protein n=1 Tax=Nothophoma quercina TaxID=749835 RepID=A0ABR3S2S9_9PLEO
MAKDKLGENDKPDWSGPTATKFDKAYRDCKQQWVPVQLVRVTLPQDLEPSELTLTSGAAAAAAFEAEDAYDIIQVFERRETPGGTWY